jgi:hypothetical protein
VKRIRNLGLAVIAALVLSALSGASSASASFIISKSVSTNMVGTSSGSLQVGVGNSVYFDCAPNFSTYQAGSYAEKLAVDTPNGKCTGPFGHSGTLDWKNCDLTFRPGKEVTPPEEGTPYFESTFEIGPAGCGPVILKNNTAGCVHEISPQTIPGKASSSLAIGVAGLLTSTTPNACGFVFKGTHKSSLNGAWSVAGTDVATGKPTGVSVSRRIPVGLYIFGEEPKFQAELYPAIVEGKITTNNVFTFSPGGGTITCNKNGGLLSAGSVGGSTAKFPFDVGYTSCWGPLGSEVKVNMKSCDYVFGVANSGPPYTGTVDIECANEGDAVVFEATAFQSLLCRVTYPPQTLGTASYELIGSITDRRVVANITGKGLKFTRFGSSVCGPTAGTEGLFSGQITMEANFEGEFKP